MTGREPLDIDRTQLGYAYILLNPRTGFYKLGSARNPMARLKSLCRELHANCELIHTIATNNRERLERVIQAKYPACMVGGEWYDLSAEQVASLQVVSAVWWREGWQPRSRLRADFDAGAAWARKLPVCGCVAAIKPR